MNRRTRDFFQSKHGQGILNALNGKWSDAVVTKYFDSLHRDNDVKWQRAMGFIAGAAGVNAKTFKTWDEGERLLIRQIEKLYNDYKSVTESINPMNLKQIIAEEVRRGLLAHSNKGRKVSNSVSAARVNEASEWAIGKSVQYKNLKTAKPKINKIVKKLGNGKWELDGGKIAYEKDPEFVLMNESYGADFTGPGLVVKGRTPIDNNTIKDIIEDHQLIAYWNARKGYWFFPEEPETLDELEKDLSATFDTLGVTAKFESQE
jgi:hypothetical protein